MEGSIQRVRAVIRGETPDRPPLYDLLRNDAVISRFAGEDLNLENAAEVVPKAYEPAIDATRPSVRLPGAEKTVRLDDGRTQRHYRWTTWTEPVRYADTAAFAAAKRDQIERFDPAWNDAKQRGMEGYLAGVADMRRRLGEVFFFPGAPGLGLMGMHGEAGLEQFCMLLMEAPDIIDEMLEQHTVAARAWIEHLPEQHGIEAVFVGDDVAFQSGPLFSPVWFERHYMPRFARVLDAYHARGIRVLFHSDGDLRPILAQLVDAGIDGLNPLEVLAGMDPVEIHRLQPKLFLCGGIDVSQLLPFGTADAVRDAVRRALDGTGGRLMVGSTTELNNEVPLENFLALRDVVLNWSY